MNPTSQLAQGAGAFVDTFNDVILYPTIALLTAVAFLVFLWGCAMYVFGANNDQARQQGVQSITWGIVGLVVMISAWAILEIAAATFGLEDELTCADNPESSACDGVFTLPGDTSDPVDPSPGDTSDPVDPSPGDTSPPTSPFFPGGSQI